MILLMIWSIVKSIYRTVKGHWLVWTCGRGMPWR